MLVKTGVNSTRAEKHGPIVKEGVKASETRMHRKSVRCPVCDARLEKSCPNEMVCEISTLQCPKCGADVC